MTNQQPARSTFGRIIDALGFTSPQGDRAANARNIFTLVCGAMLVLFVVSVPMSLAMQLFTLGMGTLGLAMVEAAWVRHDFTAARAAAPQADRR